MKKLSKEVLIKIEDAMVVLSAAIDDGNMYFDEKSEKWQDSDSGMYYRAWLDDLETAKDALENLPQEPGN